MIGRILVTLDGSTFAEAAVPAALALARKTGGVLRLLAVHEPGWALGGGEMEAAVHAEATRYLGGVLEALQAHDVQATAEVREGNVADAILDEADAWQADLVVMATHGRGALARAILGSVTDQCVRRASRPVLLIRPPAEGTAPDPWNVARVVVPLDGSELAEAALGPAAEVADRFGAPLELLRVVAGPATGASLLLPDAAALSLQLYESERNAAGETLDRTAARLRSEGFEPLRTVLLGDAVAQTIDAHAAGDLVVIATHARGGVERAVLGSVAAAVVHGARGPVLVVPPPESSEGAPGRAGG